MQRKRKGKGKVRKKRKERKERKERKDRILEVFEVQGYSKKRENCLIDMNMRQYEVGDGSFFCY